MNDKEKLEAISEIVDDLYNSVVNVCELCGHHFESPKYAKIERLKEIIKS